VNEEQHILFTYEGESACRLDKVLVERLPELSRSRLQALIRDSLVIVDGLAVTKTGYKLEGGQSVAVTIPAVVSTDLVPEEIALDIVFENDDLLVVNKPAGMVVHPAAGHDHGTLVHAALAHAPQMEGIGGEHRPGIVHRLDKDTSGLIVLAKNDRAHRWLQRQFKDRLVTKVYLTLVDGQPPTPRGRVEATIGRDSTQRKQMAVVSPSRGRMAVSEYFTEKQYAEHTLLKVQILTGRTHQIRVHMNFLGCPVVGDTLYGRRHPTLPIKRQFLHAAHLEVRLPGEDEMRVFDAPLPEDLQTVLDALA
jgi:23S rRNA pseudouridine1911/1915/1917 synthase